MRERTVLAVRLAECGAQEATLRPDLVALRVAPDEVRIDLRPQMRVARRLRCWRGLLRPRAIELEDATDARDAFTRDDVVGERRFQSLVRTCDQQPSSRRTAWAVASSSRGTRCSWEREPELFKAPDRIVRGERFSNRPQPRWVGWIDRRLRITIKAEAPPLAFAIHRGFAKRAGQRGKCRSERLVSIIGIQRATPGASVPARPMWLDRLRSRGANCDVVRGKATVHSPSITDVAKQVWDGPFVGQHRT